MSRDVRALPFMPLFVGQLLASDTWQMANGDEAKALVTLWARSWHQVPAGTLPDDDRILAGLSGAGARWKRVREVALRGFVRGADGRLHHAVIEQAAEDALGKMVGQQTRTAAARAARKAKLDADRAARDEQRNGQRDNPCDEHCDRGSDNPPDNVQRERERKPNPPLPAGVAPPSNPKRASPKVRIPPGFADAVSDRVWRWAKENGYDQQQLAQRLEQFVSKAKAKGYTYADWDEAFMGAIRDDWAKLNPKSGTRHE